MTKENLIEQIERMLNLLDNVTVTGYTNLARVKTVMDKLAFISQTIGKEGISDDTDSGDTPKSEDNARPSGC